MNPAHIGAVLATLEPELQVAVALRIATRRMTAVTIIEQLDAWMDGRAKTGPEILGKLDEWSGVNGQTATETLEQLDAWLAGRPVSDVTFTEAGVEALQRILAFVDRETERTILDGLAARDPALAEAVTWIPFGFDDIVRLDDRAIQRVIREVDRFDLALALATANDALVRRIYRNMSKRAATELQDDIAMLGPTRMSDINRAQDAIVDVIRRLEESGAIVIERWG